VIDSDGPTPHCGLGWSREHFYVGNVCRMLVVVSGLHEVNVERRGVGRERFKMAFFTIFIISCHDKRCVYNLKVIFVSNVHTHSIEAYQTLIQGAGIQ